MDIDLSFKINECAEYLRKVFAEFAKALTKLWEKFKEFIKKL